jgi:hypothetical protein
MDLNRFPIPLNQWPCKLNLCVDQKQNLGIPMFEIEESVHIKRF